MRPGRQTNEYPSANDGSNDRPYANESLNDRPNKNHSLYQKNYMPNGFINVNFP